MGKMVVAIDLTDSARRELGSLASRCRTAQGLAQRARIVLLAAEGVENKNICERVGAAPNTVGKWRRRFAERRMEGLLDEPHPGAPRQIGDDEVAEIVRLKLEATPREATRIACLFGQSRRIGALDDPPNLEAFSLQPHRAETFKLSTDPLFVEKCATSSAFTLSPPERAIVLCVEKRARFRRSIDPSRFCPCAQAKSSGARMTTRVTEPSACSGASRHHRQSSANASPAIGRASSAPS
jgi:transposase-like protein